MSWEQRLSIAKKSKCKCFTDEDRKLASLWSTCPISEVADRIELKEGKVEFGPIDIYLVMDGIFFTKGVEDGNVDLAVNCYEGIRSQVIALENGTDRITRTKQFLGES